MAGSIGREDSSPRGRTALITGGSKGIGFELAKQFASHGYSLVLAARDMNALEYAASRLERKYDCMVNVFCVDLTTDDGAESLYRQLEQSGIAVDVLVNNAGVGAYGSFSDTVLDEQLAMLRLNVLGPTSLIRRFLPEMLERGEGRILNVSSLVAYFPCGPSWAVYVASKHYVQAFSKALARELQGTGVSVTVLCPGPTVTGFIESSGVGRTGVYRALPKVAVSRVARAGYHATVKGRPVAVPGAVNKVLAFLGGLPPRWIAQSVFTYLSRGSSQHT